jgi:2,3-dihydro-2,3-dihydroxybenzoate dehydrogenase
MTASDTRDPSPPPYPRKRGEGAAARTLAPERGEGRVRGEFTDRIAVVSGGASGIGRAIVEALDACGCRVAVLDIADIAVVDAAAGSRLLAERVDVSEPEAVDAAVARIEAEWGAIDYGVSVAGILATGPIVETDDETWVRVMSVNASGVFHLHRALARRMMPRRRGSLVTVSSNAAGIPRHGMAAYAASKAAATMMTKCLGLELAASGIRCNVVSPGSTRTPMQEAMWARGSSEETVLRGSLETYRTGIPLGKIAEPHEVAEAVLFLLSARASHITMADLYVDGGATPR